MSSALMSGLMAGANFGTGYLQGQQTSIQNQNTNNMNALALDEGNLRVQQEKLAIQQQQALSDRAMQLFSTSPTPGTPGGGTPVPPANMGAVGAPPGGQPAQDPNDPSTVSDKLMTLGNSAAASGDLTHANELWTNATNMKTEQFKQQQTQAAVQTGELKRQQQHYQMASQLAATVPDTPEGFNQWKMAILSDPNSSDQERQNLTNMQYRPGIMDTIRDSGMTASQNASAKIKQMQLEEKRRTDDLLESHRQRQDTEREAHDQATEAAKTTSAKAGAAAKAPSANDIAAATEATKSAMGDGVDTKDPAFIQARASVAARALQIVRDNRAVTYPQAVSMAAQESKNNGEFTNKTTADTHSTIFGMKIPLTGESATTSHEFNPKGDTRDTPIPFTGQSKSALVPGKFYQTGNGLMQWSGTGWKPQE